MPDQAKNIMIGIFVTSACAIVVFMLLFLHPSVGDKGQIIRARFSDIDKVTLGTRVTFSGMPVGEVIAIREIPEAYKDRKGYKGYIYTYELDLAVDSGVKIFNTDSISLRTSGLLGERTVNIMPMPALPNEKLRIVNDEVLYADESSSVQEAIKDLQNLSDKADELLSYLNEGLSQLKKEDFWTNVGKSVSHVESITRALDKPEEVQRTVDNIEEFTNRLLDSWETVDDMLVSLQDAAANTADLTKSGADIAKHIEEGKGSVGQIVMKDDLYLRVTSVISKVETLADDVNHYGLLYHLDKGWQRLRARRLNLLQKLSTPQEFRNYFNDEMDQITTSLSRVYMLLDDQVCKVPYTLNLAENCNFTKVYAELLRRVGELEDTLKMYNTLLMDQEVGKTELRPCSTCSTNYR